MAIDAKTLAASKKYTKDTVDGAGAIKGKNCTIDSVTPITGGQRVIFKWTLDNGTIQTTPMDVMDGPQGASVSNMTINASGHLIVTFDDGTVKDAGAIPGGSGAVDSVNGKTGVVVLNTSDITNDSNYISDASYVHTDNNFTTAEKTSLAQIPLDISALQGSMTNVKLDISQLQGSLLNKVDKVAGKGLSTEDFLTSDMTKLRALLEIKSAGTGLNFNSSTGELTATGAAITIDTVLDPTSTNPVQNKTIALPVQALQGSVVGIKLDVSQLQGSMLNKADKTDVPTSTSQLTNDSNFVSDASYVHTDNNYSSTDKADVQINIPLSISQLQASLLTKAPQATTYTKTEVNNLLDALKNGRFKVVSSLPTTGIDKTVIYFVPNTSHASQNYYDEYICLDTTTTPPTWELIGSTQIDLSNYIQKSSTAGLIKNDGSIDTNTYLTTHQDISGKADKVSGATNGNFASLDSNGNLTDSGHKHSDYLTSHQSLANYYQTGDTAETDLADADYVPFYDTSATAKRKTLWSNIKTKLKAYFDGLYASLSSLDSWTATATVDSSGVVDFSSQNLSDSYGYDLYCQNKLIGISSITRVESGGVLTTLKYTVTGASTGDVCKLRILK